MDADNHPARKDRLQEVLAVFLRLGTTAFGGPAAHIAILRDEVVRRRRWLDDQTFLDLLGATNLIPGPNSTEMTIHLGYLRAGWPGLIAGGLGFILPAMVMVMGLAWAYVRFGALPATTWLLYGVKPVVIALIVHALWILGRNAIKGPLTAAVGAAAFGLYLLGVNEIGLLLAGGVTVMLVNNRHRIRRIPATLALSVGAPLAGGLVWPGGPSLMRLFLTCLKIGSVLYGSGYVLLAFLRADFVVRLGWLTDQQLIDAVAVGQVTPGPLFTTATFIGYLVGGVPGALLATLGIFLPSFVFVAATHAWVPHMRQSIWLSSLLDGVIVASLALMAAVTIRIGRASLVDPLTVLVALVAVGLLLRTRLSSTWLILAGALTGVLTYLFRA